MKNTLKGIIKKILKSPELFVLQRNDEDNDEQQKKIIEEFNNEHLKNIFEVCEAILTKIEINFSEIPS